jgi:hypothetical protein
VKREYTGEELGWIGDDKLVELSPDRMAKPEWEHKVSPEEAMGLTARWTLANS